MSCKGTGPIRTGHSSGLSITSQAQFRPSIYRSEYPHVSDTATVITRRVFIGYNPRAAIIDFVRDRFDSPVPTSASAISNFRTSDSAI